ncbi:MAG: hypothetical protein WCA23_25580, partial [Stellaceae bacterium]
GPTCERLLRRTAIAAAGIINESVARQRRCRRPELQGPDVSARGSIIGASEAYAEDQNRSNDRTDA